MRGSLQPVMLGYKKWGEYVTFVDGDDFVSQDYLMEMIEVAKTKQADLVISSHHRYSDDDKMYYFYDFKHILNNEEISIEQFVKNFTNVSYCVVWGKLYHKKLFDKIRFSGGRLFGEDKSLMVKVALKATKIWGLK